MTTAAAEPRIAALTEGEVDALASAAIWYANYHGPTIAQEAGEVRAAAVVRRERFLELITGLRKLGVPILPPDGVPLPQD